MCGILCGEDLKQLVSRIEEIEENSIVTEPVSKTIKNNEELIKYTETKYFFGNIIVMQRADSDDNNTVKVSTPVNKKGSSNESEEIAGGKMTLTGSNITLTDVLLSNVELTNQTGSEISCYAIGYWIHF